MVLQHFGLTRYPLGKAQAELWDDGAFAHLQERFNWLLQSPGVGLLTGEAGVGKTATLRQLTGALNPHRYQVVYLAETDFGRLDLYRPLALALRLEPAYRRAVLWCDIKARIEALADGKGIMPLWIIDEAHNLPVEFFRDLPAFLNFAFDSRDLMTVWLLGHPVLGQTLERAPYAALASRLQVHVRLMPVIERERFHGLIKHAFQQAGAQHHLLSDSGLELLRQASRGLPRQAGRILKTGLHPEAEAQLRPALRRVLEIIGQLLATLTPNSPMQTETVFIDPGTGVIRFMFSVPPRENFFLPRCG